MADDAMPTYNPDYWNQTERKQKNNCYNYAANAENRNDPAPKNTIAFPGCGLEANETQATEITNCASLRHNVELDGLEYADDPFWQTEVLPPKEWYVASYRNKDGIKNDFHFVRLDKGNEDGNGNKLWSHKRGDFKVSCKDDKDKDITDPENAYFEDYAFCDYFLVKIGAIHIRGPIGDEAVQVPNNAT